MEELFPLAAGLALGVAFAADLRWLRSWPLRAVLIVLAGGAATVGSGEFRTSWGFGLVDVGEVALLAWIGFAAVRYLQQHLGPGAGRRSSHPS